MKVIFFALAIIVSVILYNMHLKDKNSENISYIYHHDKARAFFDLLHSEGYDDIQAAKFVGSSKGGVLFPFLMRGGD